MDVGVLVAMEHRRTATALGMHAARGVSESRETESAKRKQQEDGQKGTLQGNLE